MNTANSILGIIATEATEPSDDLILPERAYPKRAHHIEINAGADTQEDLIAALHDIIWKLKGGTQKSITGGASAGYFFEYKTDPEMTRAKYMQAIKEAEN